MTPDAQTRPIYLSRTMLLAVGLLVASVVQWRWGWVLPPELQLAVGGLLVGVLRVLTDRPVRVVGERRRGGQPPEPREPPSGPVPTGV